MRQNFDIPATGVGNYGGNGSTVNQTGGSNFAIVNQTGLTGTSDITQSGGAQAYVTQNGNDQDFVDYPDRLRLDRVGYAER